MSQPYARGGPAYWTTYTYDALGRTTAVTAADGSTTSYAYAGNTVKTTEPAGHWKQFTMDTFGNLTSVVEPDDTQTSGLDTTTYVYDVLNHLTNVSMTGQQTGQQAYN